MSDKKNIVIVASRLAIKDFYTSTKSMEYMDYHIDEVLRRIINSLCVNGSIETAIDNDFHSILNQFERPNDDNYIMANAYKTLARSIYNELRGLDLWDSNGMLCVEYYGIAGDDLLLMINRPVHITPQTKFTRDTPMPAKFINDDWVAPLYWDTQ